ncbi:geranylgeranyl reductase family protein [Amnibacterium kyonggiense]|uniref:Geranylgeranyl reductase family protein n=1 Tax=Amnibacterium kyonggiense TaxID=595671 RepID=A0A4R7FMN8_9MICO|nr:geranylgeranyl reductase family protein [Amnibacterium kyonggiense]TDS77599.1 geranylgeranyl reductase family protein [Amnibacterium kyonggiense]
MTDAEVWDVVVVGAGPAGSSAARVAAERGRRVLLLDAARFPRYKTCGGGLIGTALELLPSAALTAVERRVATVSFSLRGGPERRVRSTRPFLALARREVLDQALVDAAVAAGATFRDGTRVTRLAETGDGVALTTSDGPVLARTVVGADGSASVVARHVGVRIARADLGLEVELAGVGEAWEHRVHLDWGHDPGTYGWVFPKADRLTVGVIQRKGEGTATRAYLARLLAGLGLEDRERLHDSGHLTRWREPGSPVRRGRVLVAGDAAGLLEPWTREGITAALRSGLAAGAAAAEDDLPGYEAFVARELEPDQRAGARLLRVFERAPALAHLAVTRTGPGARRFVRFSRGEAGLRVLHR